MIFPSWQDIFVALHAAESLEELWAVLITPHGIKSSSAWEEPFVLFRRFHNGSGDDAIITALLLCTDHRWRKGAHRLIRQLAGCGLLGDDDLDELAARFAARKVTVTIPGGLIVDRQVWPPLRRWAAARRLSNDPSVWRELLDQADAEPGGDGAAVAAGVMDAAEMIPPEERARALDQGLGWGSGTVRVAALPAFARLFGDDAARRRASEDPSEKVRRWSPDTRGDRTGPASGPLPASTADVDDHRRQPSLFDGLGLEG